MSCFIVSKSEPVTVYGGSMMGLQLAQRLLSAGYNVVAILDRNPGGVPKSTIPVMTPDSYYADYGDAFVYIALGNGIQHTNIAQKLRAIGFTNILFLPLFLRSKAAKDMVQSWNTFFAGVYDVPIPAYDTLWDVLAQDFVLLEDRAGFVVSLVHQDYVYTLNNVDERHPFSIYVGPIPETFSDGCDLPISNAQAIDYLSRVGRPFCDDLKNFLKKALFCSQELAAMCASPAIFNSKGYFNLLDGNHRCQFMLEHGFNGIPLRIRKSEWELFFQERQAQALMDYCKQLPSLPFIITHPAFIMFPIVDRVADSKFIKLYKELYNI